MTPPAEEDDTVRRRAFLQFAGLAGTSLAWPGAATAFATDVDPAQVLAHRLGDVLLGPDTAAEPVGVGVLREALTVTQREFAACRYLPLADRLPVLLTAAEATAATYPDPAARRVLVESYNLATRALIKLKASGLEWLSADRALHAARTGEDPLTLAESQRLVASVARRAGHHDRAQTLTLAAADHLNVTSRRPAPEHLAMRGSLYCSAGYAAARAGDRDRANDLLAEAEATAARLTDHPEWHRATMANLVSHRVSAAYLLGDAGAALAHAHSLPSAAIPPPNAAPGCWSMRRWPTPSGTNPTRHTGPCWRPNAPDGTPPPEHEPVQPERELRRHIRRDGKMEFKGRLDAESAALFEALLKPFEKPHSDVEGPDTRTWAERGGDAFTDVLRQAANCPDLPTHNGLKTEVAFTISLDAVKDAVDNAVLPGNSSQLTARDARRLACDAHALPAVMGGNSQPLDVAVPQYVVPAHIRRALVLRDRGCSFPSCDRPASVCDAHHLRSWLQGGPTELENLTLVCARHHRLIHRSEWTVKLVDNTAYFTPPAYVDPQQRVRRNTLHRP